MIRIGIKIRSGLTYTETKKYLEKLFKGGSRAI